MQDDQISRAANQGDVKAQRNLDLRYAKGRGAPKDDAQAVQWFRKAADQDDKLASMRARITQINTFTRNMRAMIDRPYRYGWQSIPSTLAEKPSTLTPRPFTPQPIPFKRLADLGDLLKRLPKKLSSTLPGDPVIPSPWRSIEKASKEVINTPTISGDTKTHSIPKTSREAIDIRRIFG